MTRTLSRWFLAGVAVVGYVATSPGRASAEGTVDVETAAEHSRALGSLLLDPRSTDADLILSLRLVTREYYLVRTPLEPGTQIDFTARVRAYRQWVRRHLMTALALEDLDRKTGANRRDPVCIVAARLLGDVFSDSRALPAVRQAVATDLARFVDARLGPPQGHAMSGPLVDACRDALARLRAARRDADVGTVSRPAGSEVARRLEQALARITDADLDLLSAAADAASYDEISWALGEADRRLGRPQDAFDPVSIGLAIDAATRESLRRGAEQRVRIHAILLQIMMGDVVGAIRRYADSNDQARQVFDLAVLAQLERIRKARERILAAFAHKQPPKAYAGNDPGSAARAQDRSAKYTQFVQTSTQLMDELQNTERELLDALQSQFRTLEAVWQTVSRFRDQEHRTNDRVASIH